MVRIEQQVALIESVQRQIEAAERARSWKRRDDLKKYKRKLVKELEAAEQLLGI